MKVTWEGGCRTDEGPVEAQEFVLYSENVRWRAGRPETLDLYTKLRRADGSAISLPIDPAQAVTVYNDRDVMIIGNGTDLWTYRYDTQDLASLPALDAGPTGRWWFAHTEEFIYCARSNLTGRVQSIDRATLGIAILENSPVGALCGGIVDGVLVLGGTTSVSVDLGLPNPPPAQLVVRWSARRTDPVNADGFFGFEDWTQTDINSGGENLLDTGQAIIGGGESQYGFVVWTDATMYIESPRADLLVFDQDRVSDTGLYANGTWCVKENTIYFLDETRTVVTYDGGPARRLVNPMTMVSTEIMGTDIESASMVRNSRYGEVMLLYKTPNEVRRQLALNTADDQWYAFRQDWLDYAERQGNAPAISINTAGEVFSHSLREAVTIDYVYPPNVPRPIIPEVAKGAPASNSPVGQAETEGTVEPEPIEFFLSTNYLVTDTPLQDGPRGWNVIVSHTYGTDPDSTVNPVDDVISVQLDTFDLAARNNTLVTSDTRQMNVGSQGSDFRAGGKSMQVTIFGTIQSFLRFGTTFVDHIKGARR